MTLKITMVPITKNDISSCLSIANFLCGLDYASQPVSPLRILEISDPLNVFLWIIQKMYSSIPEIYWYEVNGIVIVGDNWKFDRTLEIKMNELPVLWMTTSDEDRNVQTIRFKNTDDKILLEEFNKWIARIRRKK